MIEYYSKLSSKERLKKIQTPKKDILVKAINPDESEIDYLCKNFGIKRDLIQDGLDIHEIPRIEEEKKKAYFFVTAPTSKIENESTSSFLIIVSGDFIIFISRYDLEIFDRILVSKNTMTNKNRRILLQILLFISNSYNSKIRDILKEVKKNRKNLKNLNEKDILNLVLQEDLLNDYNSSFSPLIGLHSVMIKLKSLDFEISEKEFIEDLIIDLNQTLNSCISALKSITNMRDYYSTTVSNNLNKILTVLTIFTVMLSIPAAIFGFYGMNIRLPFQNNPYINFFILAGIFVIWVFIIFIFKKKKLF